MKTQAVKTFVAHYRWRDGANQLNDTWVEIQATSLKKAKDGAKADSGHGDRKWFMDIERKEVSE